MMRRHYCRITRALPTLMMMLSVGRDTIDGNETLLLDKADAERCSVGVKCEDGKAPVGLPE